MDNNDAFPVLYEEVIAPSAVDVVGAIHTSLIGAFRESTAPQIDFPSMWRLAKIVVNETSPLIIYRHRETGAR